MLYYASRLTSQTGQGVFFALLVLVAGPGTGGALGLGSVMVAMTVAAIVLGPVGGAIVDRLGPRVALPVGALLRALAVGLALIVIARGEYAWIAAFGYSAASQIFSPAELALVSTIRRRRPAGAHASLFALQFGGQAIGAFLLAPALFWLGGTSGMLVGAFALFASVVALTTVLSARLPIAAVRHAARPRSARRFIPTLRFMPALRFITGEPQALYAVGLLAFVDVLSKCLVIAAPIYFQAELHLGRGQVVVLAAAVALGGLIGLGWSARFVSPRQSPLAMRLVLLAALLSIFALAPLGDELGSLTVSGASIDLGGIAGPIEAGSLAALPALLVLGMTLSMAPIIARSVLTSTAPAEQQGRVFAAEAVFSNVLAVPAVLLAALSTDIASGRATMMFIGIVGGAVFLMLEYHALRRRGWAAANPVPAPTVA
ncbi:MAG: MFS transporter [Chloroflexi bacterium]|nr:MFS transporter [Chloroflexota bacterium]MDA1145738.1 MFS transporter [Chloroflexota bacterium]